jgi:hypothetical protein
VKGAWGGSCEQEVKTWDLDLEHYGEVQIWHIFDKKTLSQMNLKKRGGIIRTGSKNMGSRSKTQWGSSNMTNYLMMPKQTKYYM